MGDDDLYVVSEGVLDIAGMKLHTAVLNDGRRVVRADDVHSFFDALNDGTIFLSPEDRACLERLAKERFTQ